MASSHQCDDGLQHFHHQQSPSSAPGVTGTVLNEEGQQGWDIPAGDVAPPCTVILCAVWKLGPASALVSFPKPKDNTLGVQSSRVGKDIGEKGEHEAEVVGVEASGMKVSSPTPLSPPKACQIFSEVWALTMAD